MRESRVEESHIWEESVISGMSVNLLKLFTNSVGKRFLSRVSTGGGGAEGAKKLVSFLW